MCNKSDVILAMLALFCSGYCEKFLPSYITPCDVSIANYSYCIKEQMISALPMFSKGIPEMGVAAIDPADLDDLHVDGSGLKLHFADAKMQGLGGSNITKVNFTLGGKDEYAVVVFKCNLNLTAKYDMSGRVLILPIEGKGDAIIKCNNITVSINATFIHTNNSKGEHLKLVIPKYQYDIEKTIFQFKNLFNGSKALSDTTHRFLNENWKQLMDDLAPPIINQIVKTLVKCINKFLANAAIDDIFRNYTRVNVTVANDVAKSKD